MSPIVFTKSRRAFLEQVAGIHIPWDQVLESASSIDGALDWGKLEFGVLRRATNVGFPIYKGSDDKHYLFTTYFREVQLKPGADPTIEKSYERAKGSKLLDREELIAQLKGTSYSGRFTTFEEWKSKGYFDLSEINPDLAQSALKKKMMHVEQMVSRGLWEKGVVFIRDPAELLGRTMGVYINKDSFATMALIDTITNEVAGKIGGLAAIKWVRSNLRTETKPIYGKTGMGYRVTMRPTIPQISKHTGFKLRAAI